MIMRSFPVRCAAVAWFLAMGVACGATPREKPLPQPFERLVPLHQRLGPPQPGDWLAEHAEPGQTYWQYLRADPVKPDRRRRTLYVQPLGEFNATQRAIIDRAAQYMGLYFDMPVRVRDELPLKLIPTEARRKHPSWGMDQILSTYVLEKVLHPRLPKDAMAYIAFTTSDLWPGEGWNFVFGQASLVDRVGVWSLHRFGDPDESAESRAACLRRTLKIGTHETGHMFSMQHCTLYECNMCAGNHMVEMDRHPLWLCPHCLAKLCWATGADPKKRFERLAEFCKTNGMEREQAFFEKSLETLRTR